MRKVILLIVLLAALGGVVYLKSVRQSESEKAAFVEGKNEGAIQAEADRQSVDSLASELNRFRSEMLNTLRVRDSVYFSKADSLAQLIVQQSDSIVDLEGRVNSQPNSKRVVAEAKAEDSTRMLKHKEILDYYTSRFRDLPSDLTAYEERVATSEIRTETLQKFAITEKELNTIRKDANIDF